MKKFPKEEYSVPFFKEEGFIRKLCPTCNTYFWTQNLNQQTCMEATPEGCAYYDFIGNPPTSKKYGLQDMRETFLSFFEKRKHVKVNPYPVVARWREDIYLTHASIIDFQPYVTEGISPPPANPLVIVQPCIRMVDISNTGPTFGRHLTNFEMGGHHAFNYPNETIYWKDQTVRFHHEFVTKELGIHSTEVTYKEDVWIGGGNAGPDLECIIRGLEVATLVFMQYKIINNEFIKLPIKTVDTGYGIDRLTWLSQGVPTGFHAVYGQLLEDILTIARIPKIDYELLGTIAKFSGLVSYDKFSSKRGARIQIAKKIGMKVTSLDRYLSPIENVFTITDHTKTLSLLLAEGIVPSNIKEGYLVRLLFRRTYRLLKMLGIPEQIFDIINLQVDFWGKTFPHLKQSQTEMLTLLKMEYNKFIQTIKRGERLTKRIAKDLKDQQLQEVPVETLTSLYDTHGLPPEFVQQFVENEGLIVHVPENFYTLITERHISSTGPKISSKSSDLDYSDLPETKQLYYEDVNLQEFEAQVLKISDKSVVLNQTCFYPEGGGQPSDTGYLFFEGKKVKVVDVQKTGKVIIHKIDGVLPSLGISVKGKIDWEKRYMYMKNHAATHIINGAARRVLGHHVYQFGAQKGVQTSRLDISHYQRLTLGEMHEIERLANQVITRNIPIDTTWMSRNQAEQLYGFRLYQGGAVPGKEIRVVKSGDWEVEACAGTHVKNSIEIGFIKIIHSERVQDGVERLTYSVGSSALIAIEEQEQILWDVADLLNSPLDKLAKTVEKLVKELKTALIEKKKLMKELALHESTEINIPLKTKTVKKIAGCTLVMRDFEDSLDVDRMVFTATELLNQDDATIVFFYGQNESIAKIFVMVGKSALQRGVNAREIVQGSASIIGGGGGGETNFAQGGGPLVHKLPRALQKAENILTRQLKSPKET